MIEIWKDIIGYEGFYQISNVGRVKSLERITKRKYGSSGVLKELIMRPGNNEGYLWVNLFKDGIRKKHTIHKLVAMHFIINSENKPDINHKDGIKSNNIAENLEWVTKSENTLHAYKTLLKKPMQGILNGMAKLNNEKVIEIKQKHKDGRASYRELSIEYRVDKALIARIIKGKAWPHVTLKTA